MYAVVTTNDITDREAADTTVVERVIPMVKQEPGFVGGYWVRFDGGHDTSAVAFEMEEQARSGAPEVGSGAPGVTCTNLMVGDLLGHA
jgi:hypothetical protein